MAAQAGPGAGSVRSVERAALLLRLLAAGAEHGARLSDLAVESGLGKATAHRILTALSQQGLVYQDGATRRYHLGFEVVRLARAARRYDIVALARPALQRITADSGDVAFFSVREGDEAVCLARELGAFPIKTLTLGEGDRRPLGVGAGSLALLACLPEAECHRLVGAQAMAAYPGYTPAALLEMVARTRRDGYSLNEGRIVTGMVAVGVPVFGPGPRLAGAISLAAIEERIRPPRRERLVALLGREAARIGHELSGREPAAAPDPHGPGTDPRAGLESSP